MSERLILDPLELILHNRQSLTNRFGIENPPYTPPSPDHYPHLFLWDSMLSATFLAEKDLPDKGAEEVEVLLDGMQSNGFIPNTQFAPGGRKFDPERFTYLHPRRSSDYTQPPIMADAALATYESYLRSGNEQAAQDFLTKNYPKLKQAYKFFSDNRQNGPYDRLIFNTHPHETGRDSDPTFDFFKVRIPRRGEKTPRIIDKVNAGLDYGSVLALNGLFRIKKWDTDKTTKHFKVNDVMFNCLYANNLQKMSELAKIVGEFEDAEEFSYVGEGVKDQILSKMWFPEARGGQGAFYALNNSEPIEEVSVSNLFPLTLTNLKSEQLSSCLRMILTSFNANYPLPSVATNSPNYDPHYSEKGRIWRGGTWINTNYFIAEGLAMQAERQDLLDNEETKLMQNLSAQLSSLIVGYSHDLISQGFYEFYNPRTGKGQRIKNFSWSVIITLLKSQ